MCIVYVICAKSTGTFYTGQTSNLLKRLAQHNDPTSYSSGFRKRVSGPWVLVHQEDWPREARLSGANVGSKPAVAAIFSGFSCPFSLKSSLKGIYRLDCHFSGGINICNSGLELEKILPNTLFVRFGVRFIAHIGEISGYRVPRHYFWYAYRWL
jgi:GIY-YIG catalytic domain